jgi:dipeptidyl aminopeptidase/acylaminoacyl peptidase
MLFLDGSWRVRDDITDSGRRYDLPVLVGDIEKDREMLLANSPVVQAARITQPLQLVWGSGDRRVPLAHGRRLREAMQKAGREPDWVVYSEEAHGWRKPENQIDFARRLETFLARHLLDAGAPPSK